MNRRSRRKICPPLAARQLDAEALAYFLKAELFDQRFAACGLFVLFQAALKYSPAIRLISLSIMRSSAC